MSAPGADGNAANGGGSGSATVFVRNLPFDVTQAQLEQVFGDVGPVRKVDVIKDKGKKKSDTTSRGFAFVRFAMAADAELAIERLNQSDVGGRAMRLELAKEKQGRKKRQASAMEYEAPVAARTVAPPAHVVEEVEEPVDVQAETEPKSKRARTEDAETKTSKKSKTKASSKDEKTKRSKKDKTAAQEEPVVEEKQVFEEEVQEDANGADAYEPEVSNDTAFSHTQSERNARRRMHREFLRQVEARRESSATTEQKSVAFYGFGDDVTEKVLYKKIKKIAPVAKIELKADPKTSKQFAVVELEHMRDVTMVIQKLDQHVLKGATLRVLSLGEVNRVADGRRLIIRNLSFQANDADLEKLFGKVGSLSEAKVVRLPVEDPDNAPEGALGKSRGFGFVQFYDNEEAKKAIDQLNGFRLKGREMIVDVAVTKNKYLQMQTEAETAKPIDGAEDADEKNEADEDAGDEDEDEGEEKDENEEEEDFGTAEMEEDGDPDEDEEDADDDSEDEAVEEKTRQNLDDSDEQRARTVFLRNLAFQTTEDSLKAFFQAFGKVDYARIVMDKDTGLSKGVGFVRFHDQATADVVLSRGQHETLEQSASKSKNQLKKNKKPENAFALSALADGDALMLDGRMLIVSRSVSKSESTQLTESNSSQRKQKDKRNMYLAYEGTISVNKMSEEDLGLPRLDVEKRRRAIREKKEKLKNPMYFVSPLRLSVRNLASYVDDKQLKRIFHDAAAQGITERKVQLQELKAEFRPANDKPLDKVLPKVKMAKVVRDMENVKPGKDPRSRGYGFVEFVEHAHALAALRVLNNNPSFTSFAAGNASAKAKNQGGKRIDDKDKSRLIVEFALENHGKLRLREKKHQDAMKKREEERLLVEAQGDAGTDAKTVKKSRGQRQREIKRLRNEANDEAAAEVSATKTSTPSNAKSAPVRSALKQVQNHGDKKRKRSQQTDDSHNNKPKRSNGAGDHATEPQLSRKQRKQAKIDAHERSFDALVSDYKKQIFGDRSRSANDQDTTERWFD